jgi:hypothetical protein
LKLEDLIARIPRSVSPSSIQPNHPLSVTLLVFFTSAATSRTGPSPFQVTIYKPLPPPIMVLEPTTDDDDPKHYYCTFQSCRFYPSFCQTTLFQLEVFFIESLVVISYYPPNPIDRLTLPAHSNTLSSCMAVEKRPPFGCNIFSTSARPIL